MSATDFSVEGRRAAKVFACFSNQVRQGLGRRAGIGTRVLRAEDAWLQILPGPGMHLLSLRPRVVQGARGMECFIHCREGPGTASADDDTLVAVYRYGASAQVYRHPAGDSQPLGILSDSDVALAVALTLVSEAHQRAAGRTRFPTPDGLARAGHGAHPEARAGGPFGPAARAWDNAHGGPQP